MVVSLSDIQATPSTDQSAELPNEFGGDMHTDTDVCVENTRQMIGQLGRTLNLGANLLPICFQTTCMLL